MFFAQMNIFVQAIAIGALANEVVALWKGLRRTQYMAICTSHIACVSDAFEFAIFMYVETDDSGTSHMSRIGEAELYLVV